MGEDASRIPVRQLIRCLSSIQTTTGENVLKMGRFRFFLDSGVDIRTATKPKLIECLLYLLKVKGSDSLVVVPRLDRIGSDKDVVGLAMGIFGMCRTVVVAEQMNRSLDDVRDAESSRKDILDGLLKDRNSKIQNYHDRIENERLQKLQQIALEISQIKPRREDLNY